MPKLKPPYNRSTYVRVSATVPLPLPSPGRRYVVGAAVAVAAVSLLRHPLKKILPKVNQRAWWTSPPRSYANVNCF